VTSFVIRRLLVVGTIIASGALPGCFASSSRTTESGKGIPQLTVAFPSTAAPGATEDLVVTVSNPGPGEMDSVFVAFANVGAPGSGLGNELIPFASGGENPAIADIDPQPESVSQDGVVYRFPALAVGESTTITFSVIVPVTRGPAASSVQVYDGNEVDRAAGERVSITVQG
jgi:hypothetical protein